MADVNNLTKAEILEMCKLLNNTMKTNIGNIPIKDYLEIYAVQNGFDDYEDLYNNGYRVSGYKNITPEMLDFKINDYEVDDEINNDGEIDK